MVKRAYVVAILVCVMRLSLYFLSCALFVWFAMKRKFPLGQVPRSQEDERLNYLRHSKFVTRAALSNVAKEVQREPVQNISATSQFRARKSLAGTLTPYGPLVEEVNVDKVNMGISNPLAAMWWSCKHSSSYANIVFETMRSRPPTVSQPWNLIFYQDGVDPGDGLAKSKSRKSAVYYTSIAEFGPRVLGFEQVWFCATVIRQNQLNTLLGDHCRVSRLILERMFSHTGIDAERGGIMLEFPDRSRHQIYVRLGVILADEPALKEILSCKGHAGHHCCAICKNCVLLSPPGGADSYAMHSTYLKDISEKTLSVTMLR